MRRHAQKIAQNILGATLSEPLFKGFGLMALNGFFLGVDALWHYAPHSGLQAMLGVLVLLGCGCFALADRVRSQTQANFLTKLAPTILVCANMLGLALALRTLNPFLLLSTCLFITGNIAGYFTHIDKA